MVQRICLGFCLFMVTGCSDGDIRSGIQRPVASASADIEVGAEVNLASEQPTVMLRCEEGRIGAYVVTGEFEGEPAEDQMVRISLDSAPDC